MELSENIIERRDELVTWIKKELKSVQVSVYGEADKVLVQFQDVLICGVVVDETNLKIYNASVSWSEQTTYACEDEEDGTKYYYVDSIDECIGEVTRLVLFEIRNNTKKNTNDDFEYSTAPLYSQYWHDVFGKLLGNVINEEMSGFVTEHSKEVIRFECYGTGAPNRLRVYLNKANSRNPEIISIWIGSNVFPSKLINPGSGKFKDFPEREECNNKFVIYPERREQLIREAYNFVKDVTEKIRQKG